VRPCSLVDEHIFKTTQQDIRTSLNLTIYQTQTLKPNITTNFLCLVYKMADSSGLDTKWPIPVVMSSKPQVFDLPIAGTAGSIPAEGK